MGDDVLITHLGYCPYCGSEYCFELPSEERFVVKAVPVDEFGEQIGEWKTLVDRAMYCCLECGWCWQEGEYL